MPAINQFIHEATSLNDDDYIGVDQKVGSVYVTKKIKKSNAFPVSYFRTAMGNPPLTFATGSVFSPVIFNAAALNPNSEYNTTNGRFTPLKLGIYELSLAVVAQGLSAGDTASVGIYGGASGTTLLAQVAPEAGSDGRIRGFVSIIIDHSTAGHFYRVLVNNSSGSTLEITPDGSTYFMGKRIA